VDLKDLVFFRVRPAAAETHCVVRLQTTCPSAATMGSNAHGAAWQEWNYQKATTRNTEARKERPAIGGAHTVRAGKANLGKRGHLCQAGPKFLPRNKSIPRRNINLRISDGPRPILDAAGEAREIASGRNGSFTLRANFPLFRPSADAHSALPGRLRGNPE